MHLRKKIGLFSMLLMMVCVSIPAHADTTKEPWTKSKTQTQNLRIRDITTNGVHAQRVYNDGHVVYTYTHDVTYVIDNGNEYKKEIENNTNGIGQAPAASKPGWTFVGWKMDHSPDGSILYNHTVKSDTTYYAVYKRTVTVSAYGGDATTNNLGVQYYNSGSVSTVDVKLENQPTKAGWQLIGYKNWSDEAANEKCAYAPGDTVQVKEDMKLRAVFKKKVTVTSVTGNNHVKQTSFSGWRYYNNGAVKNPTINIVPEQLNGWSFYTFAENPQSTTPKYQNQEYEFSTDTNIYPVYRRESAISYDLDGGKIVGTPNQDYSINVAWYYAPSANRTLLEGLTTGSITKAPKNSQTAGWSFIGWTIKYNNNTYTDGNARWIDGCYTGTASAKANWKENIRPEGDNYSGSALIWEEPRKISGDLTVGVLKFVQDSSVIEGRMGHRPGEENYIDVENTYGINMICAYGMNADGTWTDITNDGKTEGWSIGVLTPYDSNTVRIPIRREGDYYGIYVVATSSNATRDAYGRRNQHQYELSIRPGWNGPYLRFTLWQHPNSVGSYNRCFTVTGMP